MKKGYIKFYRQIQDCWIWDNDEPYDIRSAWSDLLLSANHADKSLLFDGNLMTITRGQLLTSIRKLSAKWKWSTSKVTHFLALLEKDNMITKESDTKKTLLTIVNYDIYQGDDDSKDTVKIQQKDSEKTAKIHREYAEVTQKILNKNDKECIKNDKNVNNIYSAHFEEVWKIYPKKKDKSMAYKCYLARLNSGFSEEELLIATKNYAEECRKEERPEKYIKNGSTFFGVNTPFVDYLKESSNNSVPEAYVDENTRRRREKYKELEKYYLGED